MHHPARKEHRGAPRGSETRGAMDITTGGAAKPGEGSRCRAASRPRRHMPDRMHTRRCRLPRRMAICFGLRVDCTLRAWPASQAGSRVHSCHTTARNERAVGDRGRRCTDRRFVQSRRRPIASHPPLRVKFALPVAPRWLCKGASHTPAAQASRTYRSRRSAARELWRSGLGATGERSARMLVAPLRVDPSGISSKQ